MGFQASDVDIPSHVSSLAWDDAQCIDGFARFPTLSGDVMRFECDRWNDSHTFAVADAKVVDVRPASNGWLVFVNETSAQPKASTSTHSALLWPLVSRS